MTLPAPADYGQLRHASDWLRQHAGGELDRKVSDQLNELVRAVIDSGRKGSVTLRLVVERSDDLSVVVHPAIKSDIPQPSERPQHFYVDASGALALADPYRQQLPFSHDLTGAD